MNANEPVQIRPQPGPQEQFLSSAADIVIYGGAAGGGKSYGLLLEPLRHALTKPGFGTVIFRRNSKQVRNTGGLWDTSEAIYNQVGLIPRESILQWEHPGTGNTITFDHLEHEKSIYNHQGAQIALIGFDELTHFTAKQDGNTRTGLFQPAPLVIRAELINPPGAPVSYRIGAHYTTNTTAGRSPGAWTLERAYDEANWELWDAREGESGWAVDEIRTYTP